VTLLLISYIYKQYLKSIYLRYLRTLLSIPILKATILHKVCQLTPSWLVFQDWPNWHDCVLFIFVPLSLHFWNLIKFRYKYTDYYILTYHEFIVLLPHVFTRGPTLINPFRDLPFLTWLPLLLLRCSNKTSSESVSDSDNTILWVETVYKKKIIIT